MTTPRKVRSSFAIVPCDKAANESIRLSLAGVNTSVFSSPEVSDVDKLLARCSQEKVVPFAELLPEETLLACKKVRFLFVCESELVLFKNYFSDWRRIIRRSLYASTLPL